MVTMATTPYNPTSPFDRAYPVGARVRHGDRVGTVVPGVTTPWDVWVHFDAHDQPEVVAACDLTDASQIRPCAGCGRPCTGRWCSDSCRRAEDGVSPYEDPDHE